MTTTNNLLVELFVEELPPKALKKLGDAFAGVLREQLEAQGLADAGSVLTAFASPRRLAAHLTARARAGRRQGRLAEADAGERRARCSGNATPGAAQEAGGAGRRCLGRAGLKRAMDGKAEALFYDSTAKGATLAEGLQKALAEAIAKLPIPKVMSYQLESGCDSRLDQRELRAPGARPGGAARRRRWCRSRRWA